MEKKKIWRNNEQNSSKCDKNYNRADPMSLVKLKHKKHNEIYTKAHYNQIAQNL